MSLDSLCFFLFSFFAILTSFNLFNFGVQGYCYSWLHSDTQTQPW